MIYVLGDSFCFGWNFLLKKIPNREQLMCPYLLADKLGMDYKNYSLVGSSNYRLSRLAHSLDIKKDDIVVISWSSYDRIEIGVPKDKIMPNDFIVDYQNLDSLDDADDFKVFQLIEKTEELYTRQIYPTIIKRFDDVTSPSYKNLVKNMLHYASDRNYHELMFKILFHATVHRLRTIGCKFVMFTTWDVEFSNTDFLNIPEYLFYKSNMLDEVRYKDSKIKHKDKEDFKYWTEEEHRKVANIIYNALREKYDIQ